MDYFEKDGIDNHKQVELMLEHARAFEDAYMGLSKPLQRYLDTEFAIGGKVPFCVALFHLATATEVFAELMGVEMLEAA